MGWLDDIYEYSSDSDWDRAAAIELGADRPDAAWILTDRDVWHRNPHYTGPPVPHPEDYDPYDDGLEDRPDIQKEVDLTDDHDPHPF